MKTSCSVCLDDRMVVIEDVNLGLYRCGSCGHAFKDIPKERQEKYEEDYFSDTHKNWFDNPDYVLFEFIHKMILRLTTNKRLKILDAGCGKGDFLKYLRGRNSEFELYGIDLTDNEYPGINFIKGDIFEEEMGIKFDVICNLAVIEHLASPHIFIKKIKDLLSPGGILFTVTDNDDGLIYKIARFLKNIGIGVAYDRLYMTHHLQCFSNKSLVTLMEMNGFDLIIRRNHNHSVKAVDYPKANPLALTLYMVATHIIFFLSMVFDRGILQITVCRKK